jgi:hypothetical protein
MPNRFLPWSWLMPIAALRLRGRERRGAPSTRSGERRVEAPAARREEEEGRGRLTRGDRVANPMPKRGEDGRGHWSREEWTAAPVGREMPHYSSSSYARWPAWRGSWRGCRRTITAADREMPHCSLSSSLGWLGGAPGGATSELPWLPVGYCPTALRPPPLAS